MSDKKYCLTLLALVVLAIFISCNNRQSGKIKTGVPLNAIKIKLQLEDSLGAIDFFVPVRYDTSISWVDYSDCGKSCDKRKYRMIISEKLFQNLKQKQAGKNINKNIYKMAHMRIFAEKLVFNCKGCLHYRPVFIF